MRQYFWILCIGIPLYICGEPEVSMYGYVDPSKSHMSSTCKNALEHRMQQRCQPPAFYPGNGHPVDFTGCNFTCRLQSGETTIEQHVNVTDGVPCGPKGEKCKNGLCVGGKSPELKDCADLVRKGLTNNDIKPGTDEFEEALDDGRSCNSNLSDSATSIQI